MRPEGDGVYYEVRTSSGQFVHGLAPDVETANRAGAAARNRRLYACHHCARTVVFDQARELWTHSYPDPGADPRLCHPNKPDGTKPLPTGPKSRDREFTRGLWPIGSVCGPG
ncbi:hypothetical protein [Pseudonocardia sp. MH-G8]|uniref:hypothetical protein n=1 Tax=Pseudonocardia sp. MH-G8 TaxID=1854588 RepID=UPI000BA11125|nr:hypothetical protein [Pseudonocardia sp. MH-G8]OZM82790.1 hypothetical protein CFP66_08895 [Pseudonocardia sp. MH-G8]